MSRVSPSSKFPWMPNDVVNLRLGQLVALVPEAHAHLHEEPPLVNELHTSLSVRLLAVREHPDVSGDASVVEEHSRAAPQWPPVSRVRPIQQRMSLSPAPASLVKSGDPLDTIGVSVLLTYLHGLHLRQHVLEELQRSIVDALTTGVLPNRALVAQAWRSFCPMASCLLPSTARRTVRLMATI